MKRVLITLLVLASATACGGSSTKISGATSPTVDVKAAEASAAAAAVASYKAAQAKAPATTSSARASAAPASTEPAATSAAPASSAAPSSDGGGPKVFKPGYIATVTDDTGTVLKLQITLKKVSTKAPDEYSDKPKNGYFVTVLVKATAVKKWDVNPYDFYAKDKDGQHYSYGSGNAIGVDSDTQINDATLAAGEKIQGTVTFDVPSPHPIIEYAPQEEALGGWQF